MYEDPTKFSRTTAQRTDQSLAWERDDKHFFASGACHILAYTFKNIHPDRGIELVFIKPIDKFGLVGCHMYAREGIWAFDHAGWTKESELLDSYTKGYQAAFPGWGYSLEIIDLSLEDFCRDYEHRGPAYFYHLPWERTYGYINKFDEQPPVQ